MLAHSSTPARELVLGDAGASYDAILLSTDVDAMTEEGSPALLHVSLDGNGATMGGTHGGDMLMNKMLIGAFSACLRRKRGVLLQTFVRRLVRCHGGGASDHSTSIFRERNDEDGDWNNAVFDDVFQLQLDQQRVCMMGLVPPTSVAGGRLPVLLCLLAPSGLGDQMPMPVDIVFKSVLAALGQGTSREENSDSASKDVFRLLSAISKGSAHLQRAARAREATSDPHPADRTSAGNVPTLDELSKWWAALQAVIMFEQPSAVDDIGGDDCLWHNSEDDEEISELGSGHGPQADTDSIIRACIYGVSDRDQSLLVSHKSVALSTLTTPPSATTLTRYVIQDTVLWMHGKHMQGPTNAARAIKPVLLLFASDVMSADWTFAASRTPFVRVYAGSFIFGKKTSAHTAAMPTGFVCHEGQPHNSTPLVVIGCLGTTFMALVMTPLRSSVFTLGATRGEATLGVERALYAVHDKEMMIAAPITTEAACDVSTGSRPLWSSALAGHLWPRTFSALFLGPPHDANLVTTGGPLKGNQRVAGFSPIGFELRLCERSSWDGDIITGHLLASFLNSSTGLSPAPLSSCLPQVKDWFHTLCTSDKVVKGNTQGAAEEVVVRRFVPLLHYRLTAAAAAAQSLDGEQRLPRPTVATATLVLETKRAHHVTGSVVVACALLMPSCTPLEVTRRFSAALLAKF